MFGVGREEMLGTGQGVTAQSVTHSSLCPYGIQVQPGASVPALLPKWNFNSKAGRTLLTHSDGLCGRNSVKLCKIIDCIKSPFIGSAVGALRNHNQIGDLALLQSLWTGRILLQIVSSESHNVKILNRQLILCNALISNTSKYFCGAQVKESLLVLCRQGGEKQTVFMFVLKLQEVVYIV